MLRQIGIEEERVQLVWAAASEGNVLAAAVDRMTEQVRGLGPLRWRETVHRRQRPRRGRLTQAPVAARRCDDGRQR